MSANLSPKDQAKFVAAKRACEFVEDGMKLGLGTGSTAEWMVRCLADRIDKEGLRVKGVPTSNRTADLAKKLGIETISLNQAGQLDLTIDGTDEFDENLNLVKGGGGALLQEKVVAAASDKMIVIADTGKSVNQLGKFPLPVEVIGFGINSSQSLIEKLLHSQDIDQSMIKTRMSNNLPFATDEGNYIIDLHLGRIGDPATLHVTLNQVPGVVENGLFLNMCDLILIGDEDGTVYEKAKEG